VSATPSTWARRALLARQVARQAEREQVEQRQVVVVLDVVHDLPRLGGVAGGLPRVVERRQRAARAVGARHLERAHGPREADAREVGRAQQRGAPAAGRCRPARPGRRPAR
jgi:hypothetical protein